MNILKDYLIFQHVTGALLSWLTASRTTLWTLPRSSMIWEEKFRLRTQPLQCYVLSWIFKLLELYKYSK